MTTDILTDIDNNARLSTTTPGRVRDMWILAAQTINNRDGDFDSGRIRQWLDARKLDWAHGPESGGVVTGLVRSGAAIWTGRMAELGNTDQRAGGRLVKVYSLGARR